MAKAELVTSPRPDINLRLNHAEAQTLLDVTRHIGGDSGTRRGLMDAIGAALVEVGVVRSAFVEISKRDMEGAIYFRENKF